MTRTICAATAMWRIRLRKAPSRALRIGQFRSAVMGTPTPHRLAALRPMTLAYTTWLATLGSGTRTVTAAATIERRWTDRLGLVEIAVAASIAAHLGACFPEPAGRLPAAQPLPKTNTSPSVYGWQGL